MRPGLTAQIPPALRCPPQVMRCPIEVVAWCTPPKLCNPTRCYHTCLWCRIHVAHPPNALPRSEPASFGCLSLSRQATALTKGHTSVRYLNRQLLALQPLIKSRLLINDAASFFGCFRLLPSSVKGGQSGQMRESFLSPTNHERVHPLFVALCSLYQG